MSLLNLATWVCVRKVNWFCCNGVCAKGILDVSKCFVTVGDMVILILMVLLEDFKERCELVLILKTTAFLTPASYYSFLSCLAFSMCKKWARCFCRALDDFLLKIMSVCKGWVCKYLMCKKKKSGQKESEKVLYVKVKIKWNKNQSRAIDN